MRHTRPPNRFSAAAAKLWLLLGLAVLVALAASFGVGYRVAAVRVGDAHEHGHDHDHAEAPAEADEEEETWWTCSMHPSIRLPEFGLCPICNMDLIPMVEDDVEGTLRRFATSEEAKALMQIQTAEVRRERVAKRVRMVGKVEPDERRLAYATAWISGRIDRLHVAFTGEFVRKGDPVALLYSPELFAAQQELLQAKRSAAEIRASGLPALRESALGTVEAAREKLRLLGLRPEQIAEIEERGTPKEHVVVHSPATGYVVSRHAQEGMYVRTGERLYDVADLSRVWVQFDAYESDLPWLRLGQDAQFQVEALPGERFEGVVTFVQPFLGARTRTAKVRVEAPNPDGRLKPEMFARGEVVAEMDDEPRLVVPASAPLITGERAVVYVEVPGEERPTFEGREIVLGPRAHDRYIVRHGLQEGERVATHGNFKIDSALQIRGRPSMMTPEPLYEAVDDPMPLAQFWGNLADLRRAGEAAEQAAKGDDLQEAHRAFRRVGEKLHEVDAKPLDARALRVWTELAMIIENDAFLGGEANDLREAARYAEGLARRMGRLRAAFEPREVREARERREAARAAAMTEEVARKVAPAFPPYLRLQEALVADEEEAARRAVGELKEALSDLDADKLPGRLKEQWGESVAALREAVASMEQAEDNAARTHGFSKASDVLADLARTFGTGEAGVLHRVHCPMAFDDEGADWLQVGEDIRNPYFAGGMLTCGMVLESLGR